MPDDSVPLPQEDRTFALERIKAHLREATGEEPGDLAVLLYYDFVAAELGPLFFNAGIAAAQRVLLRATDALDAELEATKRSTPRKLPPGGDSEPARG